MKCTQAQSTNSVFIIVFNIPQQQQLFVLLITFHTSYNLIRSFQKVLLHAGVIHQQADNTL